MVGSLTYVPVTSRRHTEADKGTLWGGWAGGRGEELAFYASIKTFRKTRQSSITEQHIDVNILKYRAKFSLETIEKYQVS